MRAASIVVLASGDGSLAEALIRAGRADGLFAVAALVTDRGGINALQRAANLDTPVVVVDFDSYANRDDWENELAARIASFEPWLVVSAGFMRILSSEFLTKFKIINSHPSLLPHFPGAHAVDDALAAGVGETGCTVHCVDSGIDTGRVLAQRKLQIFPEENVITLHERIKEIERVLLPEVVTGLVLDNFATLEESGQGE